MNLKFRMDYFRGLSRMVEGLLRRLANPLYFKKGVSVVVSACFVWNILASTGYATVMEYKEKKDLMSSQSVIGKKTALSPAEMAQDGGEIAVADKESGKVYYIDKKSKEVVGYYDQKTGETTRLTKGENGETVSTVYDKNGDEVAGGMQGKQGAAAESLLGKAIGILGKAVKSLTNISAGVTQGAGEKESQQQEIKTDKEKTQAEAIAGNKLEESGVTVEGLGAALDGIGALINKARVSATALMTSLVQAFFGKKKAGEEAGKGEVSIQDIQDAAKAQGVELSAGKVEKGDYSGLEEALKSGPVIAHLGAKEHGVFVVVTAMDEENVSYIGADGRAESMKKEAFSGQFSGEVLSVNEMKNATSLDEKAKTGTKGIFAKLVDTIKDLFGTKAETVAGTTAKVSGDAVQSDANGSRASPLAEEETKAVVGVPATTGNDAVDAKNTSDYVVSQLERLQKAETPAEKAAIAADISSTLGLGLSTEDLQKVSAYSAKQLQNIIDYISKNSGAAFNCAVESLTSMLSLGANKAEVASQAILADILTGNFDENVVSGGASYQGTMQLSMASIQQVAKQHGVELTGYKVNDIDALKSSLQNGESAVVQLDNGNGQGHFVVVSANEQGELVITDNTAEGKTKTQEELRAELDQNWSGNVLTQATIDSTKAQVLDKTALENIKGAGWFSDAWNSAKSAVQSVGNAIGSAAESVGNAISSAATTVVNTVKSVAQSTGIYSTSTSKTSVTVSKPASSTSKSGTQQSSSGSAAAAKTQSSANTTATGTGTTKNSGSQATQNVTATVTVQSSTILWGLYTSYTATVETSDGGTQNVSGSTWFSNDVKNLAEGKNASVTLDNGTKIEKQNVLTDKKDGTYTQTTITMPQAGGKSTDIYSKTEVVRQYFTAPGSNFVAPTILVESAYTHRDTLDAAAPGNAIDVAVVGANGQAAVTKSFTANTYETNVVTTFKDDGTINSIHSEDGYKYRNEDGIVLAYKMSGTDTDAAGVSTAFTDQRIYNGYYRAMGTATAPLINLNGGMEYYVVGDNATMPVAPASMLASPMYNMNGQFSSANQIGNLSLVTTADIEKNIEGGESLGDLTGCTVSVKEENDGKVKTVTITKQGNITAVVKATTNDDGSQNIVIMKDQGNNAMQYDTKSFGVAGDVAETQFTASYAGNKFTPDKLTNISGAVTTTNTNGSVESEEKITGTLDNITWDANMQIASCDQVDYKTVSTKQDEQNRTVAVSTTYNGKVSYQYSSAGVLSGSSLQGVEINAIKEIDGVKKSESDQIVTAAYTYGATEYSADGVNFYDYETFNDKYPDGDYISTRSVKTTNSMEVVDKKANTVTTITSPSEEMTTTNLWTGQRTTTDATGKVSYESAVESLVMKTVPEQIVTDKDTGIVVTAQNMKETTQVLSDGSTHTTKTIDTQTENDEKNKVAVTANNIFETTTILKDGTEHTDRTIADQTTVNKKTGVTTVAAAIKAAVNVDENGVTTTKTDIARQVATNSKTNTSTVSIGGSETTVMDPEGRIIDRMTDSGEYVVLDNAAVNSLLVTDQIAAQVADLGSKVLKYGRDVETQHYAYANDAAESPVSMAYESTQSDYINKTATVTKGAYSYTYKTGTDKNPDTITNTETDTVYQLADDRSISSTVLKKKEIYNREWDITTDESTNTRSSNSEQKIITFAGDQAADVKFTSGYVQTVADDSGLVTGTTIKDQTVKEWSVTGGALTALKNLSSDTSDKQKMWDSLGAGSASWQVSADYVISAETDSNYQYDRLHRETSHSFDRTIVTGESSKAETNIYTGKSTTEYVEKDADVAINQKLGVNVSKAVQTQYSLTETIMTANGKAVETPKPQEIDSGMYGYENIANASPVAVMAPVNALNVSIENAVVDVVNQTSEMREQWQSDTIPVWTKVGNWFKNNWIGLTTAIGVGAGTGAAVGAVGAGIGAIPGAIIGAIVGAGVYIFGSVSTKGQGLVNTGNSILDQALDGAIAGLTGGFSVFAIGGGLVGASAGIASKVIGVAKGAFDVFMVASSEVSMSRHIQEGNYAGAVLDGVMIVAFAATAIKACMTAVKAAEMGKVATEAEQLGAKGAEEALGSSVVKNTAASFSKRIVTGLKFAPVLGGVSAASSVLGTVASNWSAGKPIFDGISLKSVGIAFAGGSAFGLLAGIVSPSLATRWMSRNVEGTLTGYRFMGIRGIANASLTTATNLAYFNASPIGAAFNFALAKIQGQQYNYWESVRSGFAFGMLVGPIFSMAMPGLAIGKQGSAINKFFSGEGDVLTSKLTSKLSESTVASLNSTGIIQQMGMAEGISKYWIAGQVGGAVGGQIDKVFGTSGFWKNSDGSTTGLFSKFLSDFSFFLMPTRAGLTAAEVKESYAKQNMTSDTSLVREVLTKEEGTVQVSDGFGIKTNVEITAGLREAANEIQFMNLLNAGELINFSNLSANKESLSAEDVEKQSSVVKATILTTGLRNMIDRVMVDQVLSNVSTQEILSSKNVVVDIGGQKIDVAISAGMQEYVNQKYAAVTIPSEMKLEVVNNAAQLMSEGVSPIEIIDQALTELGLGYKGTEQREALAAVLDGKTIVLETAGGKSFIYLLDFAAQKMALGDDFRGLLIVDTKAAAEKFTTTGTVGELTYNELALKLGYRLVNGDRLIEMADAGDTNAIKTLTDALNSPETVVVMSMEQRNFLNLRGDTNSALKNALAAQNRVVVDEVHIPAFSQESYIVAGEGSFASLKTVESYRELYKSAEKFADSEASKVSLNELNTAEGPAYAVGEFTGKIYLNEAAQEMLTKAGGKSYSTAQVDSMMRAMLAEKEVDYAVTAAGEIKPGSAQEGIKFNSVFQDLTFYIGLAMKEQSADPSLDFLTKIKVQTTENQSSVVETFGINKDAVIVGGSGTIGIAKEMVEAHIGSEVATIKASTFDVSKYVGEGAMEIGKVKLGGKEINAITDLTGIIKETAKSRGQIIATTDPAEIKALKAALESEGVDSSKIRVIDAYTDAKEIETIAANIGKEKLIVITNERGFTGTDYKGNIDLYIWQAEKLPEYQLLQLTGRTGRNAGDLTNRFLLVSENGIETDTITRYQSEIRNMLATGAEKSLLSRFLNGAATLTEKLQMNAIFKALSQRSESTMFQIEQTIRFKGLTEVLRQMRVEYQKSSDAGAIDSAVNEVLNGESKDVDLKYDSTVITNGADRVKEAYQRVSREARTVLESLLTKVSDPALKEAIQERIDKFEAIDRDYDLLAVATKEDNLSFAKAQDLTEVVRVAKSLAKDVFSIQGSGSGVEGAPKTVKEFNAMVDRTATGNKTIVSDFMNATAGLTLRGTGSEMLLTTRGQAVASAALSILRAQTNMSADKKRAFAENLSYYLLSADYQGTLVSASDTDVQVALKVANYLVENGYGVNNAVNVGKLLPLIDTLNGTATTKEEVQSIMAAQHKEGFAAFVWQQAQVALPSASSVAMARSMQDGGALVETVVSAYDKAVQAYTNAVAAAKDASWLGKIVAQYQSSKAVKQLAASINPTLADVEASAGMSEANGKTAFIAVASLLSSNISVADAEYLYNLASSDSKVMNKALSNLQLNDVAGFAGLSAEQRLSKVETAANSGTWNRIASAFANIVSKFGKSASDDNTTVAMQKLRSLMKSGMNMKDALTVASPVLAQKAGNTDDLTVALAEAADSFYQDTNDATKAATAVEGLMYIAEIAPETLNAEMVGRLYAMAKDTSDQALQEDAIATLSNVASGNNVDMAVKKEAIGDIVYLAGNAKNTLAVQKLNTIAKGILQLSTDTADKAWMIAVIAQTNPWVVKNIDTAQMASFDDYVAENSSDITAALSVAHIHALRGEKDQSIALLANAVKQSSSDSSSEKIAASAIQSAYTMEDIISVAAAAGVTPETVIVRLGLNFSNDEATAMMQRHAYAAKYGREFASSLTLADLSQNKVSIDEYYAMEQVKTNKVFDAAIENYAKGDTSIDWSESSFSYKDGVYEGIIQLDDNRVLHARSWGDVITLSDDDSTAVFDNSGALLGEQAGITPSVVNVQGNINVLTYDEKGQYVESAQYARNDEGRVVSVAKEPSAVTAMEQIISAVRSAANASISNEAADQVIAYINKSGDRIINCAIQSLEELAASNSIGVVAAPVLTSAIVAAYVSDITAGIFSTESDMPQLSMQALSVAAEKAGITLKGVTIAPEGVSQTLPQTLSSIKLTDDSKVIAHLEKEEGQGHFVVLKSINDGQITYVDNGKMKETSCEEFVAKGFAGNLLVDEATLNTNKAASQLVTYEDRQLALAAGGKLTELKGSELTNIKGAFGGEIGTLSVKKQTAGKDIDAGSSEAASRLAVEKTLSEVVSGVTATKEDASAGLKAVFLICGRGAGAVYSELGLKDNGQKIDEQTVVNHYFEKVKEVAVLAEAGKLSGDEVKTELLILNTARDLLMNDQALKTFKQYVEKGELNTTSKTFGELCDYLVASGKTVKNNVNVDVSAGNAVTINEEITLTADDIAALKQAVEVKRSFLQTINPFSNGRTLDEKVFDVLGYKGQLENGILKKSNQPLLSPLGARAVAGAA